MDLLVKWSEGYSKGYSDVLPERLLGPEGSRQGTTHIVRGPKGGDYTALCDVTIVGSTVTLDYCPYPSNKKEFELGVMRLRFPDETRSGTPKVTWQHAGRGAFQKILVTISRARPTAKAKKGRVVATSREGAVSQNDVDTVSAEIDFDPTDLVDARTKILASIAVRQGQRKFRDALKQAYASACAITGCPIEEVLEAAHIVGYLGPLTNHVQNGLLLRADIHTLFDMGRIGIDPKTWSVVLHRSLRTGPYAELHRTDARVPKKRHQQPNKEALAKHLKASGLTRP